MFIAMFGGVILVMLAGLYYLWTHFKRFFYRGRDPKELEKKERVKVCLLALISVIPLVIWTIVKPYAGSIFSLHLIIFWGIFDLICRFAFKDLAKKHPRMYIPGILAIVVTTVYMGFGYYFAHHVYKTTYDLKSDKDAHIKIALIADSHVGALFDGEGFAEHMKTIAADNPDILVISGDFVDDDTLKKDMVESCKALGEFKCKYGVIYVNGNHDRGYSNYRDFGYDDLISELKKNNVIVIEDEVMDLGDNLCIVGRLDHSYGDREPIGDLIAKTDPDSYTIVLDHQPRDYDAEEKAGCDLVLSGHTHGGQMIPIGHVGELLGINDATYGLERRGKTDFIVTSGIANWAVPYKTGCIAEYVIINVN